MRQRGTLARPVSDDSGLLLTRTVTQSGTAVMTRPAAGMRSCSTHAIQIAAYEILQDSAHMEDWH